MASAPSPARRAAFLVLDRVERGRASPADLLHGRLVRGLSRADLALATELVYGTLRWQGALDFVLAHHARRPVDRIDPPLRRALRLGLYQLRYLGGIPPRAAVDESVRLARAFGPPGGHGFVNAVLRAAARRPGEPPMPTAEEDPLRYLTVTLSHPEWLARRYLSRLGLEQAAARCRYHNRPPPTDLRVEPPWSVEEAIAALAASGIAAEPLAAVPGAVRVREAGVLPSPLVRGGRLFPQEAGSQLVPFLLGLGPGETVLDACAAPGAKATEMARWCRPCRVVALERRPRRLRLLRALVGRLGADNVFVVGADAERLPFRVPFGAILLDAPCSSLGTLARNPDIKWQLVEGDLARLAEGQLRLARAAADALAPGGRLVYATCSTEPEENEEVVARLLAERPGLELATPPPSFPAPWLLEEGGRVLRTLPERDEMDGYFGVVLRRRADGARCGGGGPV